MKVLAQIDQSSFEMHVNATNGSEEIRFTDGEIISFSPQPTSGAYIAHYMNKIQFVYVTKTASGYQVQIGQDHFQVEVQDERALLLESLGMKRAKQEVDGIVKAPIPGLLMKLMVSVGDEIRSGQALAILEAMKMENEIYSPRDGFIAEIYINEGEQVDKDQPILKIKDS